VAGNGAFSKGLKRHFAATVRIAHHHFDRLYVCESRLRGVAPGPAKSQWSANSSPFGEILNPKS
jgi:hypothetical protein